MRKNIKQKIWVLFVAFIFFGSIAGIAILSRVPTITPPELPKQYILSKELTPEEESFMISQGYIIIKTKCSDCVLDLLTIEGLVRKYSPYVYLIKQESLNTTVDLLSFRNTETIDSLNSTKIEDFICDNAAVRFNTCILKELGSVELNQTIPL